MLAGVLALAAFTAYNLLERPLSELKDLCLRRWYFARVPDGRAANKRFEILVPFKDNADYPDEVQGWSPERSRMLARECLGALLEFLESED